jgi:TPR repeat protein
MPHRFASAVFGFLLLMNVGDVSGVAQAYQPGISLDGRIALDGAELWALNGQSNLPPGYEGSYRPVAPQAQQAPCGGFGTPPCTGAVLQNTGPTAESLFQAGKLADARGQKQQAIDYITRSAQMGYRQAQYALGIDYQRGNGVPKDAQKAAYWLDLAAQQGSTSAQGALAEIDPGHAAKYLQEGAAQHDPQSAFDLGIDYELGKGVAHDRAKAIEYLQDSSRYGSSSDGAQIAAGLSRSAATRRFANQAALMALIPPAPKQVANGVPKGCPAWYDSTWEGPFGTVLNESRSFCILHPNCTFHTDNKTFQCNGDQTPLHWR